MNPRFDLLEQWKKLFISWNYLLKLAFISWGYIFGISKIQKNITKNYKNLFWF